MIPNNLLPLPCQAVGAVFEKEGTDLLSFNGNNKSRERYGAFPIMEGFYNVCPEVRPLGRGGAPREETMWTVI